MSKQHEGALALAPGLPLTGGDPGATSLTRELARVEEANLAFYQAFEAKDIDAMSRVWSQSPHARCVHPGWELVVGWPEIRQSWTEIFRTIDEIEFELSDAHVEVSSNTAWVNLIVRVQVTTDDGEEFHASVATTNLFERMDTDWLLMLHHSSNFGEEESEESEDDDYNVDPSGSFN